MLEVQRGLFIEFDYINWKGVKGRRKALVRNIYYGFSEYHPEEQWLLKGFDEKKQDMRIYAMKDMSNVKYW